MFMKNAIILENLQLKRKLVYSEWKKLLCQDHDISLARVYWFM